MDELTELELETLLPNWAELEALANRIGEESYPDSFLGRFGV
jgi:hypothetical protein